MFKIKKLQTFTEYIIIVAFVGLALTFVSADLFQSTKVNYYHGLLPTNKPRIDLPDAPEGYNLSSDVPNAQINGPLTVHIGQQVVYTDASSIGQGRIVRNSWGTKTKTMRFDNEGDFEVSLTVWADNGLTDTEKITVKVTNNKPSAVITVNPSVLIAGVPVDISGGTSTDPDGDSLVEFKWTLDGQQMDWGSTKNTTLEVGSHTITLQVKDAFGRWSDTTSKTISVRTNNKPIAVITMTPSTFLHDKKTITWSYGSSTDPDGDPIVSVEWGGDKRTTYPVGTYTVNLRVKDQYGLWSNWTTKTFTIEANKPPTAPVITKTPAGNVTTDTIVTITATSTDPNSDTITYTWTGRPTQSQKYVAGRHDITVKAVDQYGAESVSSGITFYVISPSGGGGVTLSSSSTKLIETVPEGATAKSYTFNVPAVSGHYSDFDYGQVKAFNKNTGIWDLIEKRSVTNGVYMTGNLTPGIYTKVEFYYYTDHSCMYGSSNITYSVDYSF